MEHHDEFDSARYIMSATSYHEEVLEHGEIVIPLRIGSEKTGGGYIGRDGHTIPVIHGGSTTIKRISYKEMDRIAGKGKKKSLWYKIKKWILRHFYRKEI